MAGTRKASQHIGSDIEVGSSLFIFHLCVRKAVEEDDERVYLLISAFDSVSPQERNLCK